MTKAPGRNHGKASIVAAIALAALATSALVHGANPADALPSCTPATPCPSVPPVSGTAPHGAVVPAPTGTTDDWETIVSVRTAGVDEAGSNGDNALLQITTFATALPSKTGWEITATSLHRFCNGCGANTLTGTVNYLLVPK